MKIDLILLGKKEVPEVNWGLGGVFGCAYSIPEISSFVTGHIKNTDAEYLVFWDSRLALPDEKRLRDALSGRIDACHCGLRTIGKGFDALDLINPVWMFNKDAADNITSTSWKLDLASCVIRKEAIRCLGFINPGFKTMKAASLELGYRYIRYGALIRYLPGLSNNKNTDKSAIPLCDEVLFAYLHFKAIWLKWLLLRSITRGRIGVIEGVKEYLNVKKTTKVKYIPLKTENPEASGYRKEDWTNKISVIIPTLRRYSYINKLLKQLDSQTLLPLEVLVVDQSPRSERMEFNQALNFPLNIIYQDSPGQSTSRNRAIKEAKGEYLLFLDDDIEIDSDLISRHAATMEYFNADSSSGVALEPGMGEVYSDFKYIRISDVFPTNNTLIKREMVERSGGFDPVFDKGKRADHDLGMRVYLSGGLMVLNPDIKIMHYRAPVGGLREHGQRKITQYSSVRSLFQRNIPSWSEFYLWSKYYNKGQIREAACLGVLAVFRFQGPFIKRMAKFIVMLVLLPVTIAQVAINYSKALRLKK